MLSRDNQGINDVVHLISDGGHWLDRSSRGRFINLSTHVAEFKSMLRNVYTDRALFLMMCALKGYSLYKKNSKVILYEKLIKMPIVRVMMQF